MYQATVLFDFDSTIIQGESFELMLMPKLKHIPKVLAKIEQITAMGMAGEIIFSESVKKRFDLAAPSLADIERFVDNALPSIISDGFKTLFTMLKASNIDIWIISGGLGRVIQPFANYLGIKNEKVIALEGCWDSEGNFVEIIKTPALLSKVDAAKDYQAKWLNPVIIVGDGYTDYQLKEASIADYFICYTEHVQRDQVISLADKSISSAKALEKLILEKSTAL
ncbi:MAG: HAD family hydrolase [Gammaproteobacteria bacterium]|nr:MAG: HAD family hydrolase [Gammaproteobacteria bacterium]UTW42199.1 HAD-IB family phosphatase [bacterium SCSIO 12844]